MEPRIERVPDERQCLERVADRGSHHRGLERFPGPNVGDHCSFSRAGCPGGIGSYPSARISSGVSSSSSDSGTTPDQWQVPHSASAWKFLRSTHSHNADRSTSRSSRRSKYGGSVGSLFTDGSSSGRTGGRRSDSHARRGFGRANEGGRMSASGTRRPDGPTRRTRAPCRVLSLHLE